LSTGVETREAGQARGGFGFERLKARDLPLIHRWLHTPHVNRWWYEDAGTCEEVSAQYSAYIEGREPIEPYLILYGGRPVGYIQSYRVSDDEEYDKLVGIEDAAGVDLFIAEEDLLYRGLGPRLIRRFLKEVVFADRGVEVCIIDPEPENRAAIRAYEKAGFRHFESVQTSGGPAYLMKLGRAEFFA
jgi:RimJ/RimL family protein N-acetyltransferase